MSWKLERYSEQGSSAYVPPSETEEINYADPRFYQRGPASKDASRHAPTPSFASENQPYPTYNQDTFISNGNPGSQMSTYRGPADLEHYTMDVGSDQREAAKKGEASQGQKRDSFLTRLGGLGAIIAFGAKFGLASITALISIGAYALLFGWSFAIGLVALLFIHEMGHAVVMKMKGLPIGGMVFIPLLGAAVFMSRLPANARDEAEVGIAGPIAGALASSVCLLIALASPDNPGIWAPLAYFGFFLNLFNLIPVVPFDGGRVLAAIDRRIWIIGFLGLVAIQIWQWIQGTSSIWLLIFIVMAATQFLTRRGAANTPEAQAYYAVPLNERIVLGLVYFGLAATLVLGMALAHNMMQSSFSF